MRDSLIELIDNFIFIHDIDVNHWYSEELDEKLANYLLANGVIVPPCKEGDKVYKLMPKCTVTIEWCPYHGGYGTARCDKEPCEAYVKEICFSLTDIKHIGKTIFLAKEEAEAALIERNKNK